MNKGGGRRSAAQLFSKRLGNSKQTEYLTDDALERHLKRLEVIVS